MIVDPVITARILDPDVPVQLRDDDGEIRLDTKRAPHVTARIRIGLGTPDLLDDIDPRADRRMLITAGDREFDLSVREVSPDRSDATVLVQLASDEAILADYAPLTEDRAPRSLEASLRDVVDYVLGKIGAELEPGGPDADVTAYWEVTNLLPNSSAEGALGSFFINGGNAPTISLNNQASPPYGSTSVLWLSGSSGWSGISLRQHSARPGRTFTASAYVRQIDNLPVRFRFNWRDSENELLRSDVGEPVNADDGWGTRPYLTATAPAGTARVGVILEFQSTAGGQGCRADGMMLYEGDELIDYFHSDYVPTGYTVTWAGDVNASPVTRHPVDVERAPESTIWPAGVSGLDFLHPLLQANGLRLVCDEQRRWTLRNADYRADGTQVFWHGVNIITADEDLSRDADEWYDGAVYVYRWRDRDGLEQTRYDTYALPDPSKITRRELDTPYPGPGRAKYAVERAQGNGRTLTATRQARWNEHTEQHLTATLEATPIQTGIAESVVFDIARNQVTTTSRTTDTPAAAWLLIPAGEAWLDSPVGESWTEEVI